MSQRLGPEVLSVMGKEGLSPTLAQEEQQTAHLKEAGLLSSAQPSGLPSFPAGLPQVSSCPLWLLVFLRVPQMLKTGRATGSPSPISPLTDVKVDAGDGGGRQDVAP